MKIRAKQRIEALRDVEGLIAAWPAPWGLAGGRTLIILSLQYNIVYNKIPIQPLWAGR